ncbi:MAG: nitrile hydratase subunit alpha, partial [Rhodospirillaceae bacterium]
MTATPSHHDHDHDHDRDHDHDHHAIDVVDTSNSDTALLADALRLVLIEKGVFTAADVTAQLNLMETRSDRNGANLVARAWQDPVFKTALLEDGARAAFDAGYDMKGTPLVVLENTDAVHNV